MGYDVVGIARMGPVHGIEGKCELEWDFEREQKISKMDIWCATSGEGKQFFASSAR